MRAALSTATGFKNLVRAGRCSRAHPGENETWALERSNGAAIRGGKMTLRLLVSLYPPIGCP